ncbi:MAG: N-6 DNA methylase [Actinomycetota bacterium]|nr:N-6 DNA methylase [Actinomycetota bacterium]
MGAPPEVLERIEAYREGAEHFRSSDFKEMALRSEFLNPVLKALGWDPNNTGLSVTAREVTQEDSLIIDGTDKAPDYAFMFGSQRQFYLEAKRPSVNVKGGKASAYQIRRYGWNAGLPLGIVTDFEEWAIYDCRFEPDTGDNSSVGRVIYFTYDELDERWDELVALFGRDNVLAGSLAKFADTNPTPRGTLTVDQAFLKEISEWRQSLAVDIAKHNRDLDVVELNTAVQTLIDRVIFLRIAEARGLEAFGDLKAAADNADPGVYTRLMGLFKRADNRYNSGLFHFRNSKDQNGAPDTVAPALTVSDKSLRHIIERLYYPHPYDFKAMPADILGRVYEQFLGATITLKNHKATVEEKPEVRKAGGVYYTPVPIVEYIVDATLGPLLKGAKPADVAKFTVVDPACGSGSFLIAAYQYLIDWHTSYYATTPTNTKKYLDKTPGGGVRLNTAERKRILLANIYGVDIDPQAVEVTKLSLLLKVIEGQTQMEFAVGRILPDLDANIRCGNTLIDIDYPMPMDVTEAERLIVNPFNWDAQFPNIMNAGGFDAVIGNPPYLSIDATWGRHDPRLAYIKSHYPDIHTDKTDILFYFLARAVQISRGEVGFIVSRSFLEADKAQKLRGWLSSHTRVREVLDFRQALVFPRVGINTAIVRFSGSKAVKKVRFRKYANKSLPSGYRHTHLHDATQFEENMAPLSELGAASWVVTHDDNAALLAKIDAAGTQVGSILHLGQGMQTGDNKAFAIPETDKALLAAAKKHHMTYRRARNSDITAFDIADNGPWLLYVEDAPSFNSLPDEIKRHLNHQKASLTARKAYERGNCDWWRYTWPLHKDHFGDPVILAPYRARDNRFAVDENHTYLGITDTTVLYDNSQPESLHYVAAVLNSDILTYRFRFIGKLVGGGTYEYFHNTIAKLPIPRRKPGDPDHDAIVELAVSISDDLATIRSTRIPAEKNAALKRINRARLDIEDQVAKLYGLSRAERALIADELAKGAG